MGRRNRERIARIREGLEKPIRHAIARSAHSRVVEELSKGTTDEQVSRLNEMAGTRELPAGKLKEAIMVKAPKQMDEAIKKYRKEGKPITVDSLLVEVRTEPGFLKMCENVGLDYGWFKALAKDRMEAHGL